MFAVIDQLENAVVTAITGLPLTLDGTTPVTVKRKKLAVIDVAEKPQLPLITVSAAAQSGRDQWFDTGSAGRPGRKRREYVLEINLAARGNRDETAHEGDYQAWRQMIMGAFEPPSALGVDALYDVEIEPGALYERSGHPRNFDMSVIHIRLI